MDAALSDKRFAHIAKDPRFKRVPVSTKKVTIDKRFNAMFSDKKFHLKYTVDKRGRPVNLSSTEQLKDFYRIESDESDEDEEKPKNEDDSETGKDLAEEESEEQEEEEQESDKEDDSDELEKEKPPKKVKQPKQAKVNGFTVSEVIPKEKEAKVEIDEDIRAKLHDLEVDYARGEGVLYSDSSSDEDYTEDEADEEDLVHDWGELDKDAEETDTPTNRLAICHMDWDRIRAIDLMVVLNSFAPQGNFDRF